MKSFASSRQRVAYHSGICDWRTGQLYSSQSGSMPWRKFTVYLPLSETGCGNGVLGEVMDTKDRLIHEPRMISASDVVLCELSVLQF